MRNEPGKGLASGSPHSIQGGTGDKGIKDEDKERRRGWGVRAVEGGHSLRQRKPSLVRRLTYSHSRAFEVEEPASAQAQWWGDRWVLGTR